MVRDNREPRKIDPAIARIVDSLTPEMPEVDDREKGRDIDRLPSTIRDFEILVTTGEDVDTLTIGDQKLLRVLTIHYVPRAEALKRLNDLQRGPRKDLIALGKAHPNLRGGRDNQLGMEVRIDPHGTHVIDPALVEESGEKAASYVTRTNKIEIDVPEGIDGLALLIAAQRLAKRHGIDPDSGVRKIEEVSVDKDGLLAAEASGEISLIPGAIMPGEPEWHVVPRMVTSAEDLEVVESALFATDVEQKPEDTRN